ncbi:MAG: hypothetical protein WAK93_10140 [Solirubrobacteraceae bacterium]
MKSESQPGRWATLGLGALVLVAVVFGVVALSAAATSRPTALKVAKAKLSGPSGDRTEPIAVSSKGVAVYELSPETTHHFLCTKANDCFALWPPVKVKSAKVVKASGVKGHLGTVHRDGFIQLTLNGHPLYTFVEDGGRKGGAMGDGLHSFKGTWHVFAEGTPSAPPTTSGSTTTPTTPGYTSPSGY